MRGLDRRDAGLFGLALAVRWTLVAGVGPRLAPDTPFYVALAQAIPDAGLMAQALPLEHWFLYFGYAAFLRVSSALLPADPLFAATLAQGVLSATSVVAFRHLALSLGSTPRAALVAAALFAVLPETLTWDLFVLSDSTNLSLLVLATWALQRGARLRFLGLAVLLLAWRPTNLVFLACAALYAARRADGWRGGWRTAVVAVMVGSSATLVLVHGGTAEQSLGRAFWQRWESGVVVNGRPGYHVAAPLTSASVAEHARFVTRVVVRRAALFWAVWLEGHSSRHRVVSLITLLPVWIAFGVGLGRLSRTDPGTPGVRFCAAVVVAYWAFHVATSLDHDLRYRIVVVPFCLLVAARALAPAPTATPVAYEAFTS